jgi:hypothetical protein
MMDLGKMLKDTTDHSNYTRWQGSYFALKDLTEHMARLLKDNKYTHKSFSLELTEHLGSELRRYQELMLTTDMGRKMKDLENIK